MQVGGGWIGISCNLMNGILPLALSIAKKREFRIQVIEPRECIHTKAAQTHNTNFIYYNKTNSITYFHTLTRIGWFVVQTMKFKELKKSI
jgi:hypothetical protein